jgi:hypothetical protein
MIAQGKWRQVWRMALARAANLQAKCEQNPSTARQRSATEKAKYDHKCATAGNVSKACKIVCQEMIPACSGDTVQKLRDLHPERSLNLNLENLPTPESLNAFWDGEEGTDTRLALLARKVPPDVMMRPADVSFDPGRGDWGSGFLQRSSIVPVPVLIQDSIVHAILEWGLGATSDTLSAHELAWCRVIVELPHHKGGLGITPLPASGMAAFYSATAHMVSWLGSLPQASEWVAGQNLADTNTWNSSALLPSDSFTITC